MREIIEEVAVELGVEILPDHLHLFVSAYPQLSIPRLVKSFKGKSAYILREEFPGLKKLPSLWTHSYFVSTAGKGSAETIKKYIEAQNRK